MKRFHVHAHVEGLEASIAFYSRLFAAEPARVETDYAKWMIEDPRINFTISTRDGKPGVDHLGFQADTEEELAELKARAQALRTWRSLTKVRRPAATPAATSIGSPISRASRGSTSTPWGHPDLQPVCAQAGHGGEGLLRPVGPGRRTCRRPGEASFLMLLKTHHG